MDGDTLRVTREGSFILDIRGDSSIWESTGPANRRLRVRVSFLPVEVE